MSKLPLLCYSQFSHHAQDDLKELFDTEGMTKNIPSDTLENFKDSKVLEADGSGAETESEVVFHCVLLSSSRRYLAHYSHCQVTVPKNPLSINEN
eukprot:SAG31_NODE_16089_length_723_cov_1.224359_1_plen_94_part_01